MGQPIELTQKEEKLFLELKTVFDSLWNEKVEYDFKKLESLARGLHLSLKDRGLEPKHHAYMIKNRALNPDQEGFYNHLHPVEDLIKFIGDQDANNDPMDQTLGEEFTFSVYTKRWGHEDKYSMKRTKTGWTVSHFGIQGDCNKEGFPYLFKNLDQDFVSYPRDLGSYVWSIWETAERGLTKAEVQALITQVANWVSQCERTKPKVA